MAKLKVAKNRHDKVFKVKGRKGTKRQFLNALTEWVLEHGSAAGFTKEYGYLHMDGNIYSSKVLQSGPNKGEYVLRDVKKNPSATAASKASDANRTNVLERMTSKKGGSKQTKYGRKTRNLRLGQQDHHLRFRTLFEPFFEGLSDAQADELAEWFVQNESPLGNVFENLEGVDQDLHTGPKGSGSIHDWARYHNIQVGMAAEGSKGMASFKKVGNTYQALGGASATEGFLEDGKLIFKEGPNLGGEATRKLQAKMPNMKNWSMPRRMAAASMYLRYVEEPLLDYTAGIMEKQDARRLLENPDYKARNKSQWLDKWKRSAENAAARSRIIQRAAEQGITLTAEDFGTSNIDRFIGTPGAKNLRNIDNTANNLSNMSRLSKFTKVAGALDTAGALAIMPTNPLAGTIALAMTTPTFQRKMAGALTKFGVRMIPGVSFGTGALSAAGYMVNGQWTKAGIQLLAGAIGEIPGGAGDVAQSAIELGLEGHDLYREKISKPKVDTNVDPKTKLKGSNIEEFIGARRVLQTAEAVLN